jgi:hypothetical protein
MSQPDPAHWKRPCPYRGCTVVVDMRTHYYCDHHEAINEQRKNAEVDRLRACREEALAAKFKGYGSWD